MPIMSFLAGVVVYKKTRVAQKTTPYPLGPDGWRDQCHHIGCPTCAKYLTDEATLDPTSVTKLLEKDKHHEHGAAIAVIFARSPQFF